MALSMKETDKELRKKNRKGSTNKSDQNDFYSSSVVEKG
jgi:hypothetical protein